MIDIDDNGTPTCIMIWPCVDFDSETGEYEVWYCQPGDDDLEPVGPSEDTWLCNDEDDAWDAAEELLRKPQYKGMEVIVL